MSSTETSWTPPGPEDDCPGCGVQNLQPHKEECPVWREIQQKVHMVKQLIPEQVFKDEALRPGEFVGICDRCKRYKPCWRVAYHRPMPVEPPEMEPVFTSDSVSYRPVIDIEDIRPIVVSMCRDCQQLKEDWERLKTEIEENRLSDRKLFPNG